MPARRRRRLPADESRRRILEAAERRLVAGGPEAVRVQAVAADLGVTDAAIHHHFGGRDQLLGALARFGARRLRDAVDEAVRRTTRGEVDLARLATRMLETLEARGYSRLVLWLALSGRGPRRGSGAFEELAHAFERLRDVPARDRGAAQGRRADARFAAALFVLALAGEPLIGSAARRSVGLSGSAATTRRFRAWLARAIGRTLDVA